jgi:hypothetical protein
MRQKEKLAKEYTLFIRGKKHEGGRQLDYFNIVARVGFLAGFTAARSLAVILWRQGKTTTERDFMMIGEEDV